jgi:alkaline phosphatase D
MRTAVLLLWTALFVTGAVVLPAAESKLVGNLVAGPMLGAIDHREALVWLEVEGAREVKVVWWPGADPTGRREKVVAAPAPHPAGGQVLTLRLGPLEAGTTYAYQLFVDGTEVALAAPRQFVTPPLWEWRSGPPDVRFLAGSCAYFNQPPYDRPGAPYGDGLEIFDTMAGRGAELMLWLGDNTYLREADYGSASGIWARWHDDRARPEPAKLFASTANYAIWDDHDYGPNDSDRSYPLKGASREAFTSYWANPSWGLPETPGIFGAFKRGDVAFFLLDGRTYRDHRDLDAAANPNKAQLGREQLEWLKTALLYAHFDGGWRSTFKVIAFGSQFLHDQARESARHYEAERLELLDFMARHEIGGVVFLSGDRHFSMVARQEREGRYPLYEFTCSPMTAGVLGKADFESRLEFRNGRLVPGTNVHERAFCEFLAHGPSDDRRLAVAIRGADGVARVELELAARELGMAQDADRRSTK